MRSKTGTCHICLLEKKLTFEHVPPRRAFNNKPALVHTLESLAIASKYNRDMPPARKLPAGMGCQTLCEECNGFTARHYGESFMEWTRQAVEFASNYESADGRENRVLLPFRIAPLNVLKQIATMALAVADLGSFDAHWELRRFVLHPFERHVPRKYAFRAYLNPKKSNWRFTQNRLSGVSVMMNVKNGTCTMNLAEIAFPPLGYAVTMDDGGQRLLEETTKLCDITHFGQYHYGRENVVFLQLPIRLPVGPAAFHYQKP